MSILKLFRIIRKIRHSQDHSETVGKLFRSVFPDFSNGREAVKKVGETALYISYEADSIIRNALAIKKDLEKLKYEVRGVKRSINHYFPQLEAKSEA